MSKATIAIAAAIGAFSGAAATALVFGTSRREPQAAPKAAAQPPAVRPKFAVDGPVDPAGVFQYGFPGPVNDLAKRHSLVSGYDRRTRNPAWVAEHITRESLTMNNGDRKHSYFAEDDSIPEKFRAKLKDYLRSGYDRGHQVPAADAKFSQDAMNDTFYLSNMCPQVGDGFNRDYWAHFEDFCRRITQKYPSVRVITGPLYLPKFDPVDQKWRVSYEVIGSPANVAVPTHFYKVVFGEDGTTGGDVAVGAFVLPNTPIPNEKPLQDFVVPLEAVERASGLTFADNLPLVRRKALCKEIECSIIARSFDKAQRKAIGPPSGKSQTMFRG